ncbi:MAG TPA: PEP-CTERM sorting domain-containing protein [Opitutales bacterium]|nr:PEP-CTERM sorting domain-containing protein [Opitutales bacterium]
MMHSLPLPLNKLISASLAGVFGLATNAYCQTTTFGSSNDGLGGFTQSSVDVTQTAVPEPSAFAFLAGGLAVLTLLRHRR